jgi:hypothetical protein
MTGAISTVLDCDRLGVPVLSVREGWLDTSGPVRPLLVKSPCLSSPPAPVVSGVGVVVAEQERTKR